MRAILSTILHNISYWHKVMGDFEITCKISGTFQNNYDKAGIMIRVDEENWILTGMEYYNSRMHHSTSVTNDFTDWTLSLLPVGCETNGVYFKFVRQKVFYECSYSDDNGETWTQTRCGEFTERQTISVGVAGACPMGEEFRVTFDDYQCKSL
jgi:regulation of enolase protein 1 (concanavalin A-like superfamily)